MSEPVLYVCVGVCFYCMCVCVCVFIKERRGSSITLMSHDEFRHK